MLLKFLRKRKNVRRIMWVLAILIIPAFLIWGTGSAIRNKRDRPDYAGRIYNKKISYQRYYNIRNVVRNYLIKNDKDYIPEEFIDQMTWARLLLLEEARREKIKTKDTEVIKKIMEIPLFQRNGAFDKKLYISMLGKNARDFEEQIRDDITISKLKDKITQDVSISDEEVKETYKRMFEKIKSSYILIPFDKFEKDVTFQESDLFAYYNSHKELFRKPEEINIRYISVPISSEEIAYKALDMCIEKKDLGDAAKKFSLEIKETGDFSIFQEIPGIGWSYDFIKAGLALLPGQIYKGLIRGSDVFYIIQLKGKKESYIPDFKDIKDMAKDAFVKDMAIDLSEKESKRIILEISDKIKDGEPFEDIVKQYNLEIKTTPFITRNDYDGELGNLAEFVEKSFNLKIREIGGPIKMLNGWAIIRPEELQPIDAKRFEKEKDNFKKKLLMDKKERIFNRYFEDLQKKAGFISYTNLK